MTWVVYAVSGLLVLAGAIAVTSGAPIIQLERGWAEVIAGTVAMSGGCVVFALGVILMRLEGLRDAVVRAVPEFAAPIRAESVVAPPQAPAPLHPPESRPPTPERAADIAAEPPSNEPAVDVAETNQGLWKRIRRPPDVPATALPDAAGEPGRVARESAPPPVAPTIASSAEPEIRHEPAPHTTPPGEPATEEPGQLGWLDRSLLKSRPAPTRARDEARIEPTMQGLALEPAPLIDQDHVRPADPAVEETGPHATPADQGPSVIGRYQAGVASYVMYSDGTIEVETESGQSHRFDSMDELKAFIARQDQPGA